MQPLGGQTVVRPGGRAQFAIWVWLTAKKSGTAKLSLTAKPSRLHPTFTVCSTTGRSSCSVGIGSNQRVELQARLAVPKKSAPTKVTLSVRATSPQAVAATSASRTMKVQAKPSATSSPTPTAAGDGGSLPPGTFPPGTLPPGVVPSGGSLPALPSPGSNPVSGFPQVSPSASASPAALPAPHSVRVADVSASLPLAVRLIGGQALGLALLAAAVTITIARLSLRRPRLRRGSGDTNTGA